MFRTLQNKAFCLAIIYGVLLVVADTKGNNSSNPLLSLSRAITTLSTTRSIFTSPMVIVNASITISMNFTTGQTIKKISSTSTGHASKTPSPTPASPPKDDGREFDGLSFFGGMILGSFICVALLILVKIYKAKKRSYHSL
ncbi:uncharacterized protein LOC124442615 isoform X2 [Xenia sp. Carnegie-2017]|uniref:uncharacterized protein LOC124442615 isoform X2 n=1 Tax=Xenia sp. Carnegie-2017 TaxID=2897299 RepID=UPI001F040C23|nr:uncharacterized protein LOC124442615 isoform X2 [Xenia sp. Carnegie-2017]